MGGVVVGGVAEGMCGRGMVWGEYGVVCGVVVGGEWYGRGMVWEGNGVVAGGVAGGGRTVWRRAARHQKHYDAPRYCIPSWNAHSTQKPRRSMYA